MAELVSFEGLDLMTDEGADEAFARLLDAIDMVAWEMEVLTSTVGRIEQEVRGLADRVHRLDGET